MQSLGAQLQREISHILQREVGINNLGALHIVVEKIIAGKRLEHGDPIPESTPSDSTTPWGNSLTSEPSAGNSCSCSSPCACDETCACDGTEEKTGEGKFWGEENIDDTADADPSHGCSIRGENFPKYGDDEDDTQENI
jgi:hypothetical protein